MDSIYWSDRRNKYINDLCNIVNNCFWKLINKSIKEYLSTNGVEKTKTLSFDSTVAINKGCIEIDNRNPYYKNKKHVTMTTTVDSRGTPLNVHMDGTNKHDSKIFENAFQETINNEDIKKNNRGYHYLSR